MLGIFRFFAIFFLIIVLLGYLSRFLLRIFVRRMQKRYNNEQQQQQKYRRKEGDVHVTKTPPKEKIVDKDVGEYVDYEEVDD
ncbi:MAG: DUF4834 family protein [Bacteroidales bacterium]